MVTMSNNGMKDMIIKFNKVTRHWGIWSNLDNSWIPGKFASKQAAQKFLRMIQ